MSERTESLPFSLPDFESAARAALPAMVYDYYAGGAGDERTLAANRAAFATLALRPRVLVDVASVTCDVELLGERLALPVLLAPTAFQRLAHPEGEAATARAATAAGTTMVLSTLSTTGIEDVAAAAAPRAPWLQVYVFRDRGITEALVRRAVAAGCRALCLTVDVAVQGKRERDARNRFRLPEDIEMANFRGLAQAALPPTAGSGLDAFIAREFDPSLGWEAMEWLRRVSGLPVLVKGIMTGEDALLAVEHGAAGVIVSNHGGRQLDEVQATLAVLPEVALAVKGRVPILLDGGVRRGTDVVKAIALGATAVLIGRPLLWGLAAAGQPGVERVLELLREELVRTLALLGRRSPGELDPSVLAPAEPRWPLG